MKMSKKWKPAMAMLMAVVMLCGMLPATVFAATDVVTVAGTSIVDGTNVTYWLCDAENGTITGEGADESNYQVKYDPATNTVTLNGATIGGDGIRRDDRDSYNIVLAEGTTNRVTSVTGSAIACAYGSIVISGAGSLNATGAANGIWADHAVTITDGANVTATGLNGCGLFSDSSFETIYIKNGTTAILSGSTYGIGGYADVEIDNANVTVTGDTAAFKIPYDIGGIYKWRTSESGAFTMSAETKFRPNSTITRVEFIPVPTYAVIFDANGGTGTMIPAEVNEGEEYTLPRCGFTAPSNKTFKAWSVGGEEKKPGNKITVSADTTVTAVWKDLVEGPTITITGLTAPQAGQSAEEWLDGNSPVLSPDYEWADAVWYEGAFDNYEEMISYNDGFSFWFNFGSGQSYTLALSLISDTPTTLPLNATVNVPGTTSAVYEYWGEGYSGDWYFACMLIVYTTGYEVSFDANGGTGTMIPAEVKEGEEYTLPECGFTAPSNKAFKAWSVGGEEKQPGDKITISADTTVTAVWILHTCSITPVEKVWPDCDNGGKEAYYKCDGCGKFFEDANGTTEIANIETWGNLPKNGHDWNTASWEKDATGHWHKCNTAGCTEKSDFAQHTPDRAAATDTDPVKCSVCEHEITPVLGHTHAHGTEWKSDEANHWNECACGNKANTAAHKDENTDGKCDVCAYNVGLPATPDDGNKPSDNPQPGDNTQLGLWIALLIVSGFGIVAITLFVKKKYSAR